MKEWGYRHHRAFIYSIVSLTGGILFACGVVAGFVFLTYKGFGDFAKLLLGASVISVIGGFIAARLTD